MGLIGISKTAIINSTAFAKLTLSFQKGKVYDTDYLVNRDSAYHLISLIQNLGYTFRTGKLSANFSINKKFNAAVSMKTGISADLIEYNLIDSVLNTSTHQFVNRFDYSGNTILFQPYIQVKYKLTDFLSINTGLHGQFLSLNKSVSLEPRMSMRWSFKGNQSISIATGLHSQMQPYYIYYYHVKTIGGEYVQQNRNLSFTRSIHYILGYDLSLNQNSRIKIETYYMYLFQIPVTSSPSSYSVLNEGTSFERFFPESLTNKGTGRNYGLEFTFEKFFSKTYFMMLSTSLYDSKYKGSDNIERNSTFNGHYTINLLGGKEFMLSKKNNITLLTGFKLTQAGGQRYTPVDTVLSRQEGKIVETDTLRNTKQFHDYFRLDLKIGVKINSMKITHEFAFDFVNVLNTKNILALIYNYDPSHPNNPPIQEEYQLGFLPLFYYKIDF
jgi:hypothetical protein